MTGRSKSMEAFNSVLWADSELGAINVGYDNFCFTVRESTGTYKIVVCEGYIGYEVVGFWDEVIISGATLNTSGSFLDRCILSIAQRLGTKRSSSGSEARNRQGGVQLTVTLHDGCELNVAMKDLRVDQRD